MAEIKNTEPKKKSLPNSSNRVLWILFIFFLIVNVVLVFFSFKTNSDLSDQKNLLILEENLKNEGFGKNYISEVQTINKVFINEKEIIDFLAKINAMSPSFNSLSLKFESSEPIIKGTQPGLPFVLEASGTTKATNLLLEELLSSSCQFKVNSLLLKSKDTFLNSTEFLLKAELLISDEY